MSGASTLVGTGVVSFETGPETSSILVTMDGTVPVVDGAGETRFCQFCVDEIHLSAGVEVPTELLADRPLEAYGDLGWTIAEDGGTINANMMIVQDPATGLNVMKTPQEIESITVVAALDVPLDRFNPSSKLVAGPDGCVLTMTPEGIVLEKGSVRLLEG